MTTTAPRTGLPPAFTRLLVASVVSNLGDGIRLTAFPLLVATITRDPIAIGAVSAATMAPWLLGPVGGTIVDRGDVRRLMVTGQVLRGMAVALLGWLVVVDQPSLTAVYVVAVVVGLGEVIVDSAANAAIPALVGRDGLERANARLVAGETVTGDVVGGPIGGLLFAVGASLPFAFDALTFLLSAAVLVTVRIPPREVDPSAAPMGFWEDVRHGLRTLWEHPVLRPLAAIVGSVNVAVHAVLSILVLLALEDLGLDERGYGVLLGVGAVGGLLGSAVADRLRRAVGRGPVLIGAVVVAAVGMGVLAGARTPVVAGGALAGLAGGGATFNVVGRSLRQALVPQELLGRVVASFRLIGLGGVPVGAAIGGVLARFTSVRTTVGVAAVALALITLGMAAAVRRIPPEHR